MTVTLEAVENFRWMLENDTFQYIPLCIFNFGHCKLYFSSIKLHIRVALMSQYLFVIGKKPFAVNQNVKYECSHCALQKFYIFAGSVYVRKTYTGFHTYRMSKTWMGNP